MTPRLVPPDPRFTTESERAVWVRLRDTLSPRDTLIANLRLTDIAKDHEADLVIVMPDVGVVVVEVKGAGIACTDGVWTMSHDGERRPVDPVGQARDAKYAIRDYVESDRRWAESSRGKSRFLHAVVTPFTDLPTDLHLPDCPRWMLHDRADLPVLAERLRHVPSGFETHRRPPSEEDCGLIVDILTARGSDVAASVTDDADERQARADRLTEDQALLLRVTRLLRRVEIRGGAGSGKTVLAMTQARQLTAGRSGRPERVALVCYSIGLASYFRREVATWPRKHRPAFVGTFEALANQWGIESGDRKDPDFWERRLPLLMNERAAELPPNLRFDSFVVDEAQDFAESWWQPLVAALRDEEQGGLFLYSDENQRLFQRFGRPPVPLVPLVLDHNLRNTRQIAEVFKPLAPLRMRLQGGEGPEVIHVQADPDEALDVADDQMDRLFDEGWAARHIALLTTGRRHPEQVSRQDADPDQSDYWDSFWDEDLPFYGHVLGFKGLERRAVVLCVNEDGTRERFRERLYVGLSRATDRLVVVGDLAALSMAGDDVVRALARPGSPRQG